MKKQGVVWVLIAFWDKNLTLVHAFEDNLASVSQGAIDVHPTLSQEF